MRLLPLGSGLYAKIIAGCNSRLVSHLSSKAQQCESAHLLNCIYLLIKAVTVLDEIVQFLSGIFHHVLMELYSMVHTKWSLIRKKEPNEKKPQTIVIPYHNVVEG